MNRYRSIYIAVICVRCANLIGKPTFFPKKKRKKKFNRGVIKHEKAWKIFSMFYLLSALLASKYCEQFVMCMCMCINVRWLVWWKKNMLFRLDLLFWKQFMPQLLQIRWDTLVCWEYARNEHNSQLIAKVIPYFAFKSFRKIFQTMLKCLNE